MLVSVTFFSPKEQPLKNEKRFLFHLKSFFRSQDIQIFVSLCHSFSSCQPLLKKMIEKNLKVQDLINLLNKI